MGAHKRDKVCGPERVMPVHLSAPLIANGAPLIANANESQSAETVNSAQGD
jgi:hypothetical protein